MFSNMYRYYFSSPFPYAGLLTNYAPIPQGINFHSFIINPDILFKKYLFIWLRWVLVAAYGTFSCSLQTLSCGMWDLAPWPGIEPTLGAQCLRFSTWISWQLVKFHEKLYLFWLRVHWNYRFTWEESPSLSGFLFMNMVPSTESSLTSFQDMLQIFL